ncbi:hypothetical protein [Nocardia rhizosphaerae]|uniref:Minor tail protein n=1 Tax=Nocardia rhizosphaerae TaxID=1691571 RepID=A0ABV8L6K7_9NOCA
MTSPDRIVPDGALSGGIGIPQPTEDAARSAMAAPVVRSFSNVAINFGAVIEAGVKDFLADLCDAITGATGGFIDLSGWARTLRADADQALNDSVTAQQTASGAQSAADNQTVVLEATNSKVQVVIDGLPVKPYWETMNLTEESSFPRTMLDRSVRAISVSGSVVSVQYDPAFVPPANTLTGAFIRCLYSGGRKVVSYIPDQVSSPGALHLVVGRMLPSGDVRIEWVSPDQTPAITNNRGERTVELPTELVFEQGETAFVGVHQLGSGNRRPLLGIEAADIPRPPTVWPPQLNAEFAASAPLVAGTALAAGTLDFGSRRIPYVSFGKSSVTGDPVQLRFFEDFESGMPTAMVRCSARYATVSGGVFVVSGLDDGIRRYLYGQTLNYDDQLVSGRIRNPSSQYARLLIRSNAANTDYVTLSVSSSAIGMYRWTGGSSVELAALNTAVADEDRFRIRAAGNVFSAERLVDGEWVVVLSHTDVDDVIPRGAGYRYTGLGVTRQSWTDSGGWGDWKAEDL